MHVLKTGWPLCGDSHKLRRLASILSQWHPRACISFRPADLSTAPMSLSLLPPPPPRLDVNRRACQFGRNKIHRRPHSPPRASRVSYHPPQVSGLTLAHPCSPNLHSPSQPPSARLIDSAYAGPFLAPGQCGRNGLPRRYRFWVTTHRMVNCL
jgi:hypothetical protein